MVKDRFSLAAGLIAVSLFFVALAAIDQTTAAIDRTAAASVFYISRDQVDLSKLLAPPPDMQSDQQRRDIVAVLEAQKLRTPEQVARAIADSDASPFEIAGGVLGPNFTAARLPKTTAFFNHVYSDEHALLRAMKDVWNRPRPFAVSKEIKAVGKPATGGSYPSGNSTRGYLTAIILANMLPEKKAELFARGRELGTDRVVAGDHFPTDIEAGRVAGTAIATGLMENAAFRQDFAEVKAELRRELGYPTQQAQLSGPIEP